MRRAAAVLSVLALGGWGGQTAARSPCPPLGALGAGRLEHRELDLVACRYGAARVRFDTAPQAELRWSRQQVEQAG